MFSYRNVRFGSTAAGRADPPGCPRGETALGSTPFPVSKIPSLGRQDASRQLKGIYRSTALKPQFLKFSVSLFQALLANRAGVAFHSVTTLTSGCAGL